MAVPSYVSHAVTNPTGGGSTRTVSAPASISSGNLLIMFLFIHNTGNTISTRPTGFSNLLTLDGSGDVEMIVEYKIADTGDESATDYTWELSSGGGGVQFLGQYSGVDNTTPINDSGGTNTSSGTSHTTPTITTTVNDCLILSAFCIDAGGGQTWSGGGTTERIDEDGSFGVFCSVYESSLATAGNVSKTGTSSFSDVAEVAIVGVAPTAGGGDSFPGWNAGKSRRGRSAVLRM